MKSVAQKHPMSCGIACVSFIAKIPYDSVVVGKPDNKLNDIGFYCPELVEYLKGYGRNYKWEKLSKGDPPNADFSSGDIVFI